MNEKRLIEHEFKWVPPHERKNRLPGTDKPHRVGPPEKRIPLLWVTRLEPVDMKSEVYLLNDSGEILKEVVASSGGFASADDEIIPISSKNKLIYNDVQLGEAVKIDEYDLAFDSDFILSISVQIKSKSLGHIELISSGRKGGINDNVLLWDTMETDESVTKKSM